jgi:hypothetical protein
LFGGNWNNGLQAGSFYWNLNNAASNANRNIGARVANAVFKKVIPRKFLTSW